MLNPGVFAFSDITLPAAGTYTTSVIENLQGVISIAWWLEFVRTSGGTTCTVYLQTSFDRGITWVDIAAHQFTTSSANRFYNITSATNAAAITPTDGSASAGAIPSGATLGDRFRLKYVTVGTYVGTLKSKIVAR